MFFNFLKSYVLSRLQLVRQLGYISLLLIIMRCFTFSEKNILNHLEFSKYYEHDCLQHFFASDVFINSFTLSF